MSRVLVTGVDGFTGRYLAPALAARGHEVHGLVQREPAAGGGLPEGIHALHVADLLDEAALSAVVTEVRPQRVAHLAGIALVSHADVGLIYRVNLIGTRVLLGALAEATVPPEVVLLASSANVYGNSTAGVLDESMPPAPANDYAVSKLAMEQMAQLWRERLPITIVRPFNYTGIGQSLDFLLPKIIDHFRRKAPVLELGNLDVERDFSDVRTVVNAYARLLEWGPMHCPVNVCSGIGHALHDVLRLATTITGFEMEVRVNPAFVRRHEVKRLVGSKALLEQSIGPLEQRPLGDTLAWMLLS